MSALLCALVFALLVAAPSAIAANPPLNLTSSQDHPVVGESITITNDAPDCNTTYTYTVDGVAQPTSTTKTLTTSFASAGDHTVSLSANAPDCGDLFTGETTITVGTGLSPQISVSPDPPYRGESVNLEASQTGGYGPPYTYEWDVDDDGAFDDGTDNVLPHVFDTDGEHTVRLRVTDSATPAHVRPSPAPSRSARARRTCRLRRPRRHA